MSAHYHIVRCPHCGDEAKECWCQRNGCHFAQSWQREEDIPEDVPPYVKWDWCRGCGRRYWYLDGREPEVARILEGEVC